MKNVNWSTTSSSRHQSNDEHGHRPFARTVFVGHVPLEMDEFRLANFFNGSVGTVRDVTILRERYTGRSKGCAFVRFVSEHFSKKATDIRYFYDPITRQRMVASEYDTRLAAGKRNMENKLEGQAKVVDTVRQGSPNYVQIDDILSGGDYGGKRQREQQKLPRVLDAEEQALALREHLEEIESRTSADNTSIFVGRFMQNLNERHIFEQFSHCGTITFIKKFPTSFRVEFAQKRMAAIAIRSMNGREWEETGKMFICDWWSWTDEEEERRAKMKRSNSGNRRTRQTKSKSALIIRQQHHQKQPSPQPPPSATTAAGGGGKTRIERTEGKRCKTTISNETIFLPMTKKYLPPLPPAPFEFLSSSESENENDELQQQTEAAKLAEEFSAKKLPTFERMKAILKLITPTAAEETELL